MKTFKQKGQLILGNGSTQIADGSICFAILLCDTKCNAGPSGGKFGRIIYQVVADLSDRVRVTPHHQLVLRHLNIHIQISVCDLSLQADNNLRDHFHQIKLLLCGNTVLSQSVETGEIQHPPDQTAEPAGLRDHDFQRVLLLFRRNGTVQDTFRKAGNGSHGGLQLMGHIGDKVSPLIFHFSQ